MKKFSFSCVISARQITEFLKACIFGSLGSCSNVQITSKKLKTGLEIKITGKAPENFSIKEAEKEVRKILRDYVAGRPIIKLEPDYKARLLSYQIKMLVSTAQGFEKLLSSPKFDEISFEKFNILGGYGLLLIGKDGEIRFDSIEKKGDFSFITTHEIIDIIRMIKTEKLDKDYVLNDFKKMNGTYGDKSKK
jgi:hypothetical protein